MNPEEKNLLYDLAYLNNPFKIVIKTNENNFHFQGKFIAVFNL
jgi:hypothetical protein